MVLKQDPEEYAATVKFENDVNMVYKRVNPRH